MNKILLIGIITTTLLTSCSVTHEYATTRVKNISESPIVQIPKLAKLDINTTSRVTGSSTLKAKRGKNPSIIEDAQKLALMDAVKKSGADIVVEPAYRLTHKVGYFKETVNCEVNGFSAKYVQLRDVTPEDSSLIKIMKMLH